MVEKRVNKFGQGPPPPIFGQCPKENFFFSCEVFPNTTPVFNQGRIFFLTKFSPNVLHVCGSPWWCSWPFDLLPQLLPPPFAALNSFLHLLVVCTAHFSNSPLKLGSPFRCVDHGQNVDCIGLEQRFLNWDWNPLPHNWDLTKAWLAGITREVGLEPLDLASSSLACLEKVSKCEEWERQALYFPQCLHFALWPKGDVDVDGKDLVGLTGGWLQISSLSQRPSSAADPT